MDRNNIIRKVVAKLENRELLSKDEAMEILYTMVDKAEFIKSNYTKSIVLKKDQQAELRRIYDEGPVEKLYTYGTDRFGFKLDKIKIDVEYLNAKIEKK